MPSLAREAKNGFIAASSATDAWVLAEFSHGARALHLDGKHWTAFRAPAWGQVFPAVFGPGAVWAFSSGYRPCAATAMLGRLEKPGTQIAPFGTAAQDDLAVSINDRPMMPGRDTALPVSVACVGRLGESLAYG